MSTFFFHNKYKRLLYQIMQTYEFEFEFVYADIIYLRLTSIDVDCILAYRIMCLFISRENWNLFILFLDRMLKS